MACGNTSQGGSRLLAVRVARGGGQVSCRDELGPGLASVADKAIDPMMHRPHW